MVIDTRGGPWRGKGIERRAAAVAATVILAALLAWTPPAALALPLAAAALVALIRAPALALAAAAAMVPFGPHLALAAGPATATPPSPLIALAVGAVALGHLAARRRPVLAPGAPLVLAAAGLLLAALTVSALGAPSLGTAALEIVRWGVFAGAVAVAGTLVGRRGRGWATVIIVAILAAGAAEAVYGSRLALAGIGPDAFGLPSGRARAFGNFGQPNPFGGYMNLVWPLAAALLAEVVWPRRVPAGGRSRATLGLRLIAPLAAAVAAACLAGLALSWSRGAWLAAMAGGGTMVALRCAAGLRRPLDRWAVALPYAALTAMVAAVAFGVAPAVPESVAARVRTITGAAGAGAAQQDGARVDLAHADVTGANFSTIERLAHWDAAVRMWADRPWLGQGPGHYAQRYGAYRLPRWPYDLGHAHNAYLNTLAETGLVGLAASLALMSALIAVAARAAVVPRCTLEGALGLGLAGSLAALAVHSVFDLLWVHDLTVLLGVLVGLTLAGRTWGEGTPPPPDPLASIGPSAPATAASGGTA